MPIQYIFGGKTIWGPPTFIFKGVLDFQNPIDFDVSKPTASETLFFIFSLLSSFRDYEYKCIHMLTTLSCTVLLAQQEWSPDEMS